MSTNPQESVYIEFLNYDWDQSADFQKYLKELGQAEVPSSDTTQLLDQAKSFFFCQETGHILSLDEYEEWKLHNGDKYDEKAKIIELDAGADSGAETGANTGASTETGAVESGGDIGTEIEKRSNAQQIEDDAPYSSNYHNLIELIMTGQPVPGVKEIPDTVLKDQGSSSVKPQRSKPWELHASTDDSATTTTTITTTTTSTT
ncbi:uncharacterized protein LODBEIA_P48730 [Lodderomyces beijingensis]|uniref:Uncharacterized protein n=1 Tax=Lodderomyces beijingensis TaxID=1775926 RepID=A0ABP0ZR54_9ASCO